MTAISHQHAIATYLLKQGYMEVLTETMGGVVYRAFRPLNETGICYKFYVAPSGKIREGVTCQTSALISADRAKLFLAEGMKLCYPDQIEMTMKLGDQRLNVVYEHIEDNRYQVKSVTGSMEPKKATSADLDKLVVHHRMKRR